MLCKGAVMLHSAFGMMTILRHVHCSSGTRRRCSKQGCHVRLRCRKVRDQFEWARTYHGRFPWAGPHDSRWRRPLNSVRPPRRRWQGLAVWRTSHPLTVGLYIVVTGKPHSTIKRCTARCQTKRLRRSGHGHGHGHRADVRMFLSPVRDRTGRALFRWRSR